MKITFVCPGFGVNGGHRVIATYARFLQARGHEVTIISKAARTSSLLNKLKDKIGWKPLNLMPLPAALQDRHIRVTSPGGPTAADVPDADIIVATFWVTAEWVAALPTSKGRKFYLLQDYEVFPYLPVDKVIATYHLPLKKIAVSDYIRSEIITNHNVKNIDVVYNSVDTEHFSAPQRMKNVIPTVGFLYTDAPRKNVRLAIDTITLAKTYLPDLQVKAFGTSSPKTSLPLPSWIDYHQAPAQQDIPSIYANCDAWLFTSEKEGFGLPILESMACRTPVLATRAGAAPDLIDGTNGKLLPASAEVFAREILAFTQMSDAEWQAFSDSAYRTATSYTWQDATDRLLAVFNSLEGHSAHPTYHNSEQI